MSASLKVARLVSLALATAFGIIGMSVGIDALVQSNRQKNKVHQSAPAGVSVSIDTSDVFDSGVVNTVVCALLAVVSFSALITILVSTSARRTSRIFAHILLFLSVWLFATLVPFTDFVANRQANVSATLDGIALPQSVIQAVQAQSGVTGIYHEVLYLRLATVFPWIAFLFGGLSAVLSYTTERSADSARYPLVAGGRAGSIRDVDDKRKEGEKVGVQQV